MSRKAVRVRSSALSNRLTYAKFSTLRPSERTDLPAFYKVLARSLRRSPGIESICDNLGYKAVVEDRRAETTMRQTAGRLTRFPRRLRLLKGRGRAQMEVVKPNAGEPGHIGLHVGAGVAVITLRRPGKMNALTKRCGLLFWRRCARLRGTRR